MITKGQKINDRYEIIRNIGEGGMANVYLGYDTILDRNVAIKILRGDLSTDEKFVRIHALRGQDVRELTAFLQREVDDEDGVDSRAGRGVGEGFQPHGEDGVVVREEHDARLGMASAQASGEGENVAERDPLPQRLVGGRADDAAVREGIREGNAELQDVGAVRDDFVGGLLAFGEAGEAHRQIGDEGAAPFVLGACECVGDAFHRFCSL